MIIKGVAFRTDVILTGLLVETLEELAEMVMIETSSTGIGVSYPKFALSILPFCLALNFAFHLHHFITQSFTYPASHGIRRFGLKY